MRAPEIEVRDMDTAALAPYANNAKLHDSEQVGQIAASIREFGFNDPVAVWQNEDGQTEIVEGHGRVLAAQRLGMGKVPVFYLNHLSDEQRRAYTHVHNQTTLNSGFDPVKLDIDIKQLDFDWESFGFEAPEPVGDVLTDTDEQRRSLAERFGIAPFSVLNAREGAWQERKRQWLALGIKSELGRGGGARVPGGPNGKVKAVPGGSVMPLDRGWYGRSN